MDDERTGVWLRLRGWARSIRRDAMALYLAGRDPRVPRLAKLAAAVVAAYALSPIDLIPDFIPVLGYLDEVILLPIAIALVIRLIPQELMVEFRKEADRRARRPASRWAAAAIVLIWVAVAAVVLRAFWRWRLS